MSRTPVNSTRENGAPVSRALTSHGHLGGGDSWARGWLSAGTAVVAAGAHLLVISFLASLNLAGNPAERFAAGETFLDLTPVPEVEAEQDFEDEPQSEEPEPEEPESRLPVAEEKPQPSTSTKPAQAAAPPAPAEAGKVLAADGDVLDLTNTIIMGTGERYAGGLTATEGTEKKPVRARSARVGGSGKGRTARPAPRSQRPENHSRPARLSGGSIWNCPFPTEAEAEGVHRAVVSLLVRVGPQGKPEEITVLQDPGWGFGRAARHCALRRRWEPSIDERGFPIVGYARLRVRFER